MYQIKKDVENWSIFQFNYRSQNTYFEKNLKILKQITELKKGMNYYERDDDESAIEGRKEICRELFGDSDISEDGEYYNYDKDDFEIIKSDLSNHSTINYKKNDYYVYGQSE